MPVMQDPVAWWTSQAWRTEAETWLQGRITAAGRQVTGPVEQPRVRIWSTQLTVATDAGRVWFKENSPPNRFEAALVEEIDRLAPGSVLCPIAVESQRGWLLLPDGGPTVAAHAVGAARRDGAADDAMWTQLLREYGELQRILAAHPDVAQLGVPRLTPQAAADAAGAALERATHYPTDHRLHLSSAEAAHLSRGLEPLAVAADELAQLGLPDTLEHNDLHTGNAFVPHDGRYRVFDFADAVWGHPLCSVVVPVRALAQEWQCPYDDPRITAVSDAYLEVWTTYAPMRRLREALPAVHRIAALHRYEAWRRVLDVVPAKSVGPEAAYAGQWLRAALT